MIKHIAEHFQEELSKATYENLYSIQYVNNQGHLRDIRRNATIYDQLNQPTDTVMVNGKELEKPVTQVFITADSGSYVALKDIQTTSFSFTMEFDVNVELDLESDLQAFIQAINGYIRTQNGYNFVCTFNEPTMSPTRDRNGNTYYTLSIFGSVAITNKSSFGNDTIYSIDNVGLKGVLSDSINVSRKGESVTIDESIVTQELINAYISSLTLVLHGRKDDTKFLELRNYAKDVTQLVDKTFNIGMDEDGALTSWDNAIIDSINVEGSIGGYIIMTVTFTRTVI